MDGEGGFERAVDSGRRGRRVAWLLLGLLLAFAMLLTLGERRERGSSLRVEVDETPAPAPATQEPIPEVDEVGRWSPVAAAPIASRAHPVAIAAGDQVLVWGGRHDLDGGGSVAPADGAAYLPADDRWEPIVDAPVAGRVEPAAAWTGTELLVWGGMGADAPLADGARYDPGARAWREMSPAPLSARVPLVSVWTGEELLVVGGLMSRGEGLGELELTGTAAAYRPGDDSWRQLAELPLGLRPRESRLSGAYARGRLVVWDGLRGLAYDVEADEWELLDSPPVTLATGGPALAIGERVLIAQVYPRGAQVGYGFLVEPSDDRWEPVPLGPLSVPGPRHALADLEGRIALIPVPQTAGERQESGALYDPTAETWARLPLLRLRPQVGVAGVGEALLVWGGSGPGEPIAALWRP